MVMKILIARDIIASIFRPLAMQTSGLQAKTYHGHDAKERSNAVLLGDE
nr:unnamed protein product [Callosobruchus chinensis]